MSWSDKFPEEDITHTSGRFQGDWGEETESAESDKIASREVPKSVTVESAISFYESHAEGDVKNIYIQTAGYLRELLALKSKA